MEIPTVLGYNLRNILLYGIHITWFYGVMCNLGGLPLGPTNATD